jgi:hypothetical protein
MSNPYISAARRQELVLMPLVARLPKGRTLPARICGAFLDFPVVRVEGFADLEYSWAAVERFAVRGHFTFMPGEL